MLSTDVVSTYIACMLDFVCRDVRDQVRAQKNGIMITSVERKEPGVGVTTGKETPSHFNPPIIHNLNIVIYYKISHL